MRFIAVLAIAFLFYVSTCESRARSRDSEERSHDESAAREETERRNDSKMDEVAEKPVKRGADCSYFDRKYQPFLC